MPGDQGGQPVSEARGSTRRPATARSDDELPPNLGQGGRASDTHGRPPPRRSKVTRSTHAVCRYRSTSCRKPPTVGATHNGRGYRLPPIPAWPSRTLSRGASGDWGHALIIARSRNPERVGRIAACGGSPRRSTRTPSQPGCYTDRPAGPWPCPGRTEPSLAVGHLMVSAPLAVGSTERLSDGR